MIFRINFFFIFRINIQWTQNPASSHLYTQIWCVLYLTGIKKKKNPSQTFQDLCFLEMHPAFNKSSIIISVCFQKQNIRFIEHYSHTFIQKIFFEVLLYVRLYGVDAKLNKTIPLLQELTVLKGNHAYTLATTILPLSILHPPRSKPASHPRTPGDRWGRERTLWWEGWRGYHASSLFSSSPFRPSIHCTQYSWVTFSHQIETQNCISRPHFCRFMYPTDADTSTWVSLGSIILWKRKVLCLSPSSRYSSSTSLCTGIFSCRGWSLE